MDPTEPHTKIEALISQCDEETQQTARRTLDYIHRGIQFRVINANIGRIYYKYPGLGFHLAEEAYSHHKSNVHFITRYASYLKGRNQPDRTIAVINEFAQLVPINDLPPESRIMVEILRAAAYRDLEDFERSRQILEKLPLDGVKGRTENQPREELAEVCYLMGDYDKVMELVETSPKLTPRLRIVRARIHKEQGEFDQGRSILEPIKEDGRYPIALELYIAMSGVEPIVGEPTMDKFAEATQEALVFLVHG